MSQPNCDDCECLADAQAKRCWGLVNARLTVSHCDAIIELAQASAPEGAGRDEWMPMVMMSLEGLICATISKLFRPGQHAKALDALHSRVISGMMDMRRYEKEFEDAEQDRKAAPRNGRSSGWSQ